MTAILARNSKQEKERPAIQIGSSQRKSIQKNLKKTQKTHHHQKKKKNQTQHNPLVGPITTRTERVTVVKQFQVVSCICIHLQCISVYFIQLLLSPCSSVIKYLICKMLRRCQQAPNGIINTLFAKYKNHALSEESIALQLSGNQYLPFIFFFFLNSSAQPLKESQLPQSHTNSKPCSV